MPKFFSKCDIPLRDVWYRFFIKKNKKKTQSLKNSSGALEQQKEGDNRGKLLLGPSVLLEYILGLQVIESTIKKQKKYSNNPLW